jgi:hypothetical protein
MSRLSAIFTTLVLACTPIGCLAAPFAAADEKVPARVAEATQMQLKQHLGGLYFKRVPWLDGAVDWNWFTYWPGQFTFRGQTYSLRLMDTTGGDNFVRLKSRAELRPGMALFACYDPVHTNSSAFLRVSASWHRDGTLYERAVSMGAKTVFSYQFYPSGRLHCWTRDDAATQEYVIEYFTPDGTQVGTERSAKGEKLARCTWRGRTTDEDNLAQRVMELYRKYEQ